MVVVSILPHADFGLNDHREEAPHFMNKGWNSGKGQQKTTCSRCKLESTKSFLKLFLRKRNFLFEIR